MTSLTKDLNKEAKVTDPHTVQDNQQKWDQEQRRSQMLSHDREMAPTRYEKCPIPRLDSTHKRDLRTKLVGRSTERRRNLADTRDNKPIQKRAPTTKKE